MQASEGRKVVLIQTREYQRLIFSKLVYRKDCRGRALTSDVASLGLKKWDRLMPTESLQDVGAFELKSLPLMVKFWRMQSTDRLLHDCPLMDVPGIGIGSWAVDLLHTWALGVLAGHVATVFRFIVKSGIFAPTSPLIDAGDRDELSLQCIKTLLRQHYRQMHSDEHWKRTGTEDTPFKLICYLHGCWFCFRFSAHYSRSLSLLRHKTCRFGISPCL